MYTYRVVHHTSISTCYETISNIVGDCIETYVHKKEIDHSVYYTNGTKI